MIKKTKSFTIIELLVVMAIIGILITMSVVAIDQVQKATRVSRANNSVLQLKAQLATFYNVYRKYPKNIYPNDPSVGSLRACSDLSTECVSTTINQPGLSNTVEFYYLRDVSTGEKSRSNVCDDNLASGFINDENWQIYYKNEDIRASRPQHYYLATCTEFGWKDFSPDPLPDGLWIPPLPSTTSQVATPAP